MAERIVVAKRKWRTVLALWTMLGAALASSFAATTVLPPLTSVSGSPRLPGKFVWADLVTDDAQVARGFYSRLFGWTFREAGTYLIASNDDRPLCGMFERPRPADQPQAKPRWIGYISVPNVARARKTILQAGGRMLAEPKKVPKRGEQAVFADTEGAVFGVVRSHSGDPEDFLPGHGDWVWMQLLSRDALNAAMFYRGVAGYQVNENTSSNRISDYVLSSKGYARATVRTIPAANEKTQPVWLPFVRVKQLTESVALAKKLGGGVLIEPKPDLLEGKVALISDPTGAAIGLMQWDDAQLKGGR